MILKGVLYQKFSNLVKKIFCLIGSIKQLIIMLLNLGSITKLLICFLRLFDGI